MLSMEGDLAPKIAFKSLLKDLIKTIPKINCVKNKTFFQNYIFFNILLPRILAFYNNEQVLACFFIYWLDLGNERKGTSFLPCPYYSSKEQITVSLLFDSRLGHCLFDSIFITRILKFVTFLIFYSVRNQSKDSMSHGDCIKVQMGYFITNIHCKLI